MLYPDQAKGGQAGSARPVFDVEAEDVPPRTLGPRDRERARRGMEDAVELHRRPVLDAERDDVLHLDVNGVARAQNVAPVLLVEIHRQPLPAIVVVQRSDGGAHFVVLCVRHGGLRSWHSAAGRRWLTCSRFLEKLYAHTIPIAVAVWRDWAGSSEFVDPLRSRLAWVEGMIPIECGEAIEGPTAG